MSEQRAEPDRYPGTSLPIALGLLLMMYPVLDKVRYGEIRRTTADRRMPAASLVLN